MLKKHRRNIKRLSKKLGITLDEAIEKFYKDQQINKNVYFSIIKKRNKGSIGVSKKEREKRINVRKIKNDKYKNEDRLIRQTQKIIKPID
jgi:hypothetical protein